MTASRWLMALVLVAPAAGGCDDSDDGALAYGGAPGSGGGGAGGSGMGGMAAGGSGMGGAAAGAGGTAGTVADAGGDAGWSLDPPQTPDLIKAPAGATVTARFHATGFQIYTCVGTAGADAGTTYKWTLKAPEATLSDAAGNDAGSHGAGPTWTAKDGSVVKGAKLQEVPGPLADAIPWLLLGATAHTNAGLFEHVTYVQRVNTTGGKALATGCDSTTPPTMESRIAYSADYYFYNGGAAAPDAGTAADAATD